MRSHGTTVAFSGEEFVAGQVEPKALRDPATELQCELMLLPR